MLSPKDEYLLVFEHSFATSPPYTLCIFIPSLLYFYEKLDHTVYI